MPTSRGYMLLHSTVGVPASNPTAKGGFVVLPESQSQWLILRHIPSMFNRRSSGLELPMRPDIMSTGSISGVPGVNAGEARLRQTLEPVRK